MQYEKPKAKVPSTLDPNTLSNIDPSSIVYVGIDPGKSGCMVTYYQGELFEYRFDKMSSLQALQTVKNKYEGKPFHITVERVSASPQQSAMSSFTFGCSFGMLLGSLDALGFKYHLVAPYVWQKGIRDYSTIDPTKRYRARKDDMHLIAQSLYPGLKINKSTADAYCLCAYSRGMTDKMRELSNVLFREGKSIEEFE